MGTIFLVIISTVRSEAMLFLAVCYFLQRAIWGKIACFRYRSFILYTAACANPTKRLLLHSMIGERAKRARHSQVCSIENRIYIIIYIIIMVRQILFL